MMKKVILLVVVLFLFPSICSAIDLGVGEGGLLTETAEKSGYDPGTTDVTLAAQIGQIVQTAMSFLGVIFTILLVYAGFIWMTARGDEERVKKARSIIIAAVIGLIIVLAAYSISYFVTKALVG